MTRLIAVIHHRDPHTSRDNAAVAHDAGYHGVCLIQMDGRDAEIDTPSSEIKRAFPGLKVYANRLATHPADAVRKDADLGLDGTWIDDPGVYGHGATLLASDIRTAHRGVLARDAGFLVFASVAFKTQKFEPNPEGAAIRARDLGFVPTTSGPATGIAPELEKLRVMNNAIGGGLAVASGTTPENGRAIAEHVDWIFVATGISIDFHRFDPGKAAALAGAVRR